MEKFVPGSLAFIKEAASRALSNSTLGYIAISDDLEGAYYTAPNNPENINSGQYLGTKTFAMTPGDKFFFMLVPNGRVQQVYDNPAIGGDKQPLFSIATDNPSDGFSIGQIADITGEGKLFVMEDMGLIQGSDRDYDDITFRVTGATSKIIPLNQLVDSKSASVHDLLVQKLKGESDKSATKSTAESTATNSGEKSPEKTPLTTADIDKQKPQITATTKITDSNSQKPETKTENIGNLDSQKLEETKTEAVANPDSQNPEIKTETVTNSDSQKLQPNTETVANSDSQNPETKTETVASRDSKELPTTTATTVTDSESQTLQPSATKISNSDSKELPPTEILTVSKSTNQESSATAISAVGKPDNQESSVTATSAVSKPDNQESSATATSAVGKPDNQESQTTATSAVGKSDNQESQTTATSAVGKSDNQESQTTSAVSKSDNQESSATAAVSKPDNQESQTTATSAVGKSDNQESQTTATVNKLDNKETLPTEKLAVDKLDNKETSPTEKLAADKSDSKEQLPTEKLAVDKSNNKETLPTEKLAVDKSNNKETLPTEKLAADKSDSKEQLPTEKLAVDKSDNKETPQTATVNKSDNKEILPIETPITGQSPTKESPQTKQTTPNQNTPSASVNELNLEIKPPASTEPIVSQPAVAELIKTETIGTNGISQLPVSSDDAINDTAASSTASTQAISIPAAPQSPAKTDLLIDKNTDKLPTKIDNSVEKSAGFLDIADNQPNATQRIGDLQNNTNVPTNLSIAATASSLNPGTFVVESASGQVKIDYQFDGGYYEGELGIFSLTGMELLTPGSPEFIAEAARRVLTNSTEGHIVIHDSTEGAKFTGAMPGEGNFGAGEYQGIKTFNMTPGDTFAVMFVPSGTVQSSLQFSWLWDLFPELRPLFSVAGANPNNTSYVLPIADATGTGNTFALEDTSSVNSDGDYNDIIFTVLGATGNAPPLDQLINPNKEWRTTPLGQQIIEYANGLVSPTEPNENTIWLEEGTAFANTFLRDLPIPTIPSTLDIGIAGLNFDISDTDPKSINDALEISLVDKATGKSLTGTIAASKNALFNITEGRSAQLAPGVTFNGSKISIDLSQIAPGTTATLQVRLVNNDSDTATKVGITSIVVQPGATPPPIPTTPSAIFPNSSPIDFAAIKDVSGSVETLYGQTSFNSTTKVLHADLALKNTGSSPLRDRLLVGVTNISDPRVKLLDAAGIAPDGTVYYDFTPLVGDGLLAAGETTLPGTLKFHNPDGVRFSYDLVFLSELNQPPKFSGTPDTEVVIGKAYVYSATAVDPEGDAITYSLLEKPQGMEIDSQTGVVTWPTAAGDIGNHAVTVRADDGKGGITKLTYTLSAVTQPPNRPPIFTSTPVVDAWIDKPYRYDSEATDPDSNPVGYSLIRGPEGMTVNPNTGLVEWTPPAVLMLGDTVLGKISLPGETDEFTFSGTALQRIYIDPLQYSGAAGNWKFDIISPSGETVSTGNLDSNKILNLTETGNYRIITSTNGDATGSYGFSVIDLSLVPAVRFDTTIKGTLSPGSEDDLFRFTGTKGQKLFFDNKTNSGGFDWVLYSADNKPVLSPGSGADMERYLPADGEYVLALRGNSSFTSTVDYSFEIITPDDITAPIVPGSNASPNSIYGELKEKGETDYYTFTGEVGQRIYFDRLFQNTTDAWSHTAKIISPSGTEVLNRYFAYGDDPDPITLKQSGTYRIEIDATGENTGTYSFSILDLSSSTPVTPDTNVSDTLTPGQETHLYKFAGLKNQRLYFDTPGGTANTNWTLYDSGNNVVPGGNPSQNTDMEVVLLNTGTYTLAIEGYNGTNPVNYSFKVITPDVNSGTLAFNTAVSGSISEKGEQDVYTFTGTKGQRVFLDTLMETPNNLATLVSPSGTKVINSSPMYADYYWRNPVILPESGTYSLTVDGSGESTDSYSFRLLDVSAAPVLQKDAPSPTSGTLNPGSIQFHQFTGSLGDRVYFDSQETSPNTNWQLYNSNNDKLAEVALSSDFEQVLPGDGTYYLMLRGENSTPVSYKIQLVTTTSPPTSLALNAPVTSSISKLGEQDVYTFTGTVGQTLYFDPRTGNSNIAVNIQSPSGKVLLNNGNTSLDAPPFTLTEPGTYKLTVDGTTNAIGDYSFILRDTASLLPLGSSLSGSLAAKETVLYKINGTAGQQLAFVGSSAISGAEWVLYAPQNLLNPDYTYYPYEYNRVGSANLNTGFTSTLPADGTYILALRNTSANPVSYSNILVNSTLPPATTNSGLGMLYGGTLSAPGEVDEYSFTAKAGTLIYFDGQSNDSTKRVSLLKPNSTNDFVFSGIDSQNDSNSAYQLTQTGPYKLQVYGSPATTTGNYSFQLVDLKASPALGLNTPINVSLNPRETKAYKFTGAAGQKVWLDGLNTSGTNVTAKLLNSNGLQIAYTGDLSGDIALQTLEADGEYYLVLQSNNTSPTSANFRLLDNNTGATTLTSLDNRTVSGNFGTSKRETVLYKFQGLEGQRLYFDRTDGDWYNYYQLYRPDGQLVFSQYGVYDEERKLPSSGEYLLAFIGGNQPNNNYGVRIVTPTDGTSSLTLGNIVNGEITKAGQQNTYTFPASEGQRLWFDSLAAASNINGTLYSPTDTVIWSSQSLGSDLEPATLTTLKETGNYRFVVDGSSDATGNYSFRILNLAAAAQTTSLDTNIFGNFGTSKREAHVYKFTGAEGQYVYFDRTDGGWSNYSVYSPDGQRFVYQNLIYDEPYNTAEPRKLPSSGEYTLVFNGTEQLNNNYALRMVTPDLVTLPHAIGDTIAGTISEPGKQDTYTFTGRPGQQLWLDTLLPNGNVTAYLYSPTSPNPIGTYNLGDDSNDSALLTLTEAGTYTLKLDASYDNTGAYSFRFLDSTAATVTSLDIPITGNFGTSKREAVAYRFNGTQGQSLYFDRLQGDASNYYYVYKPDGTLLLSQNLASDYEPISPVTEPIKLPSSGQYTLIFSGKNATNNNYNLQIVTPDLVTTPYNVGDNVSGTVSEPGEQDTYVFSGTIGQKLWFDSLGNSPTNLTVKLVDPDGATVFGDWYNGYQYANSDREPVVLKKQGNYKLIVDSSGDKAGDTYNFRLLDLAAGETLTLDSPISGDFGTSKREAKTYKFQGAAGSYAYIDMTAGDPYNYYYLYDPYGKQLTYKGLASDDERALPVTGEYSLVLSGQDRPNNNYEFKVVRPELTTVPLTLGQTVSQSIGKAGEKDTYTFEGKVGQKLFFDGLTGNSNLSAQLYDPFGSVVVEPSGYAITNRSTNSDWLSQTLNASGTYRLVVDGSNNNTGNYSFRLSDLAKATPLNLAALNTGTAEAGEVDLYQITGRQGQVLNFDLNAAAWNNGNWVLYGPDSKAIATPAWNSPDFKVALPTAGLYALAVTGNSSSPVSYSFNAADSTPASTVASGLNSTISGTLVAGVTNNHTFTANAGTQIFFDSINNSTTTNNWQIRARLIAQDGTIVFDNQDTSLNTEPLTLPLSGEYTVQVYGYYPSSSGNYQFRIAELPKSLRAPSVNYLEIGGVVSEMTNGTQAKVYTFEGVEGLRVAFNGMVGTNVSATLYDPTGKAVFTRGNFQYTDVEPVTLTQNGLYQLAIEGQQPTNQNYSFQLLELSSATAMPFNLPVADSLPNGQQSKFYKFSGTKGDRLFFDSLVGNFSNFWKLIGPDNKVVPGGSNWLGYDLEVELPATGEYALLIEGSTSTAPVNYQFRTLRYEKTAADIVTPGTGETGSNAGGSTGLYPVKLEASDGQGGKDIQEYNIRVWPDPTNSNPVIVSEPVQRFGLDDKIYRYQLVAVDPDGDRLKYRLVDGPLGALINGDSGELLWFPENILPGSKADFTVEVADPRGGKGLQTFTVDAYGALGKIQGAVFDDLNGNRFRDSKLVKGNNPAIIVAIDVSGSTAAPFAGPTSVDNVLKAQVAATLTLIDTLIAQGLGDRVNIGLIPHQNSALIQDMDPATPGVQFYTTPLADKNNNGIFDIREILASSTYTTPNGHNDFTHAVEAIDQLVPLMPGDKNVIFMSDGYGALDATVAANVRADLQSQGIGLTAFGIGQYSTLDTLKKIDPDAVILSDIDQLSGVFGGFDPRYTLEPLKENVPVYLDLNNNGTLDPNEPKQLTAQNNSEGLGATNYQFAFDNLEPGTYRVRVVPPSGYAQTAPAAPNFADTVTAAGQTFTRLFGVHKAEEPPNSDPTFLTLAPPYRLSAGESLVYRALASDPDADEVNYSLALSPPGMSVDPKNGTVVWTPTAAQVEEYYKELRATRDRLIAFGRGDSAPTVVKFNVALRANDGKGGQALQYVEVELVPPNNPPVFTSTAPSNLLPQTGKRFEYRAVAADADGDSITYSLQAGSPAGVTIDPATGLVTWTPTAIQLGATSFTVLATDSKSSPVKLEVPLRVIEPIPNRPPDITSTPRTSARTGSSYFYQLAATDPDGNPTSFTLVSYPVGMTLTNSGAIAWIPTAAQTGPQAVSVSVSDGQGGTDTQSWTVGVSNSTANRPPAITSVPDAVTNLEKVYRYQPAANDPDGDPIFWSLDSAPKGMVIDPKTGSLSWQPVAGQVGEHTVAVRATDALGSYTGQEFTLKVTGINTPPAIVSMPVTVAGTNQTYKYQVLATDPENDSLRYSLGTKPEGMKIDGRTGAIEWTPGANAVGTYEVEVLATDAQGGVGNQKFAVSVGTAAINQPPAVVSTPVFAASLGSQYTYQVRATDPDGGSLTYQLLQAPAGVTINPTTGLLTWDNPTAGNHQIAVGAVDAGGLGAAQGFTLTARANSAPVIPTVPAQQSVAGGATYRYDLKARDAEGDLLAYTLVQAPTGMTVDEFGRVSWTPAASDIGTVKPVQIAIADTFGKTVTVSYNLSVVADTIAPKVNLIASKNPADIGDSVTFTVNAVDNVKVESLGLTINGTPVVIDAQGKATVKLNNLGTVTAIATALDAAGNAGTATQTVAAIDPTDVNAPTLTINLESDTEITALVNIIGTIFDSNLQYYTLEMAPVGSNNFKEVYRGTANVTNGTVATFDPTVLANGAYVLKFTAFDANGNGSTTERTVNVAGDLKLGNFRLSFTDLSVPVAGIPISVTRTYDSLNANATDDFGYGWRMEFRDTDLKTSLKPDPTYEELGINTVPFDSKTKVFITLPGGKRETFTFKPTPHHLNQYLGAMGPGAAMYKPAFESQKGSTMTLTVKDANLVRNENGYYGVNAQPFNPENPAFGGVYILTTQEGLVYEIDAKSGDLLTATDSNGNKLSFSDAGIVSSTGKSVVFERDVQGRIVGVVDPDGKKVKYEYDAKGDLIAVKDRENNRTQFKYEDADRPHFLTEVIDPLGRSGVKTEYDEKGRLKQMVDANGSAVELIYDPNNSIQKVKDVFGKETTYVYDSRGNVLTEIDPLGKRIDRTFDDNNNVWTETVITSELNAAGNLVEVRSKTEWTYDAKGNKLTEKDALGNVSRWTYNSRGQVLTETDALGNTATYTYSPSGNLLTTKDAKGNVSKFSYDMRGNLLTLTDAANKVTKFTYDASGNVLSVEDADRNTTTFTYDNSGNRKTETRTVTTPSGVQTLVSKSDYDTNGKVRFVTDAENKVTEYRYDANGNQIAVIDALLRQTDYRYDSKGQSVETIYPDNTLGNPADNPRTVNIYDKGGRLRATIDPDKHATHYNYDDAGRLIETVYADAVDTLAQLIQAVAPGQTPATIDWTQVIYPDIAPAFLSNNPRSKTEYYKNGDVKARIDERGNRTEYRYDNNGRLVEVIYPDDTPSNLDNPRTKTEYDDAGRTVASIDAKGRVTRYDYDDLGRLVKTIYPDSTPENLSNNPTAKTEYDSLGRRISTTDSAGKTVKYEYDALGRLTAVVQTLNQSGTNPINLRTEYGYDEAGRLIWQKDAESQQTDFEYDKNGRRVAVELPLTQRSITTYDEVGNVKTVTDFNGNTVTYGYDAENRLTSKQFAPGSGETPVTVTYTAGGQIQTVFDARGTTTFTYDERGRLVSRKDPDGPYLAGSNVTIEYDYDDPGNRTEVRTPAGTTKYEYDEQNRLEKVIDPDLAETKYFYDAAGNLSRTELPNGVEEVRTYDELNRLKLLTYQRNNVTLQSFDYTLDPVGHRKVVTEQNGRKVEYEYDDLYRLTQETITDSVNGNRTISYSYDAVGNRLSKTDSVAGATTYIYDDNDRLSREELRLQGVPLGSVEYGYDANGNTKTRTKKDAADNVVETVTYNWNQENRLVGVTGPNLSVSYAYDTDGVRVSKTVNGVETDYLVDKNRDYAQVLSESVNGVVAASYVYGLDLISQERGVNDSYYLVDGLGSTRGLTDGNGVVTDTYTYDAFGNLIASAGNVENDYLFAGEQFDEDLGQYYLRQRYYNPSVGRFTRVDSYEGRRSDPMSRHDYLYAHANPVSYIDPSGLSTTMGELNSVMATIGALSAISWVSWSVPTVKLGTSIAVAAFLASYGIYLAMSTSGDDKDEDDEEDTVAGDPGPYDHLPDHPTVAPGKDFTAAQKKKIYEENKKRNGGVLRDDETGEILVPPQKNKPGVTPPSNEAQVDHLMPKTPADPSVTPGSNSYQNARLISRARNRAKSNKLP